MPGGFQPRAAVGYSLVAALEAAALAGAAPSLRDEVEAAAALAQGLAEQWGPDGPEDGEAKKLARRLHGTVPVIAGAELAAAAAYRWKCQINENAGQPAFASRLPELDHNEIVGWPAAGELGRFSAVILEDPGAHPRNARAGRVDGSGRRGGRRGRRARAPRRATRAPSGVVSLVLLGDLVSLYLAVLRGKDPVSIAPIDALKRSLAGDNVGV